MCYLQFDKTMHYYEVHKVSYSSSWSLTSYLISTHFHQKTSPVSNWNFLGTVLEEIDKNGRKTRWDECGNKTSSSYKTIMIINQPGRKNVSVRHTISFQEGDIINWYRSLLQAHTRIMPPFRVNMQNYSACEKQPATKKRCDCYG